MPVARLSWRLVWKGAVGWGAAVGLTCLMMLTVYESAYPDELSRAGLAASIGGNPAFRALYGPAEGLDTPGGFLSWRIGAFVMVIFGVWALLATSRLMRGEEESGRAELVAVGAVSRRALFGGQLLGLGAAIAVQFGAVLLGCLAGGLAPSGSVLFAASAAGCGAVFMGVAAVTSQLALTRRQAASWAALVLGATFLLRVVGSVPEGGSWVSWVTPFGWATVLSPFVAPRPLALVPFVVVAPLLVVLAVELRARRDLGASVLALADSGRTSARPPRSVAGLAVRLGRGSALAWALGVGAVTAVLGLLTIDLVQLLQDNAGFAQMAARMAGIDLDDADSFVGLMFSVVAVVLAMQAGSIIGTLREEEASERLDNLLTLPVSRARWLGERVGVGVAMIVAVGLFAAVTGFVGAASRGAEVTFGGLLVAVLNGLPVVALFGSFTLLAMAFVPRATTGIGLGLPPLLYLFYMIGSLAKWPGWLLGISPFGHLAPAPALPVNTTASLVMLALAAACGGLATWRFLRRDLAVE